MRTLNSTDKRGGVIPPMPPHRCEPDVIVGPEWSDEDIAEECRRAIAARVTVHEDDTHEALWERDRVIVDLTYRAGVDSYDASCIPQVLNIVILPEWSMEHQLRLELNRRQTAWLWLSSLHVLCCYDVREVG